MEPIFAHAGLGLERGVVEVVESNPVWAIAYSRFEELLRPALPDIVVAIEHVGSTAVPGLPAKPILDIAIGVRADADADPVDEALKSFGFLHRGDAEGERLNRMFGWEDRPRHRVVNAHVVSHPGPEWQSYIRFRDRLRADAVARDSYAQIKRSLAARFATDRPSYVAGKDDFVAGLIDEPQADEPG